MNQRALRHLAGPAAAAATHHCVHSLPARGPVDAALPRLQEPAARCPHPLLQWQLLATFAPPACAAHEPVVCCFVAVCRSLPPDAHTLCFNGSCWPLPHPRLRCSSLCGCGCVAACRSLPPDAHTRCSDGSCWLSITQVLPRPANKLYGAFPTRPALIKALLTSCHLPR